MSNSRDTPPSGIGREQTRWPGSLTPVLTAVVGGLLALAGTWTNHYFAMQRDRSMMAAEIQNKNRAARMEQLQDLMTITNSIEAAIQKTWYSLSTRERYIQFTQTTGDKPIFNVELEMKAFMIADLYFDDLREPLRAVADAAYEFDQAYGAIPEPSSADNGQEAFTRYKRDNEAALTERKERVAEARDQFNIAARKLLNTQLLAQPMPARE